MQVKLKSVTGNKKVREIVFLIIYITAFFYGQAMYDHLYLRSSFTGDYYKLTIIRFLVWAAPVFLYLIVIGKNPFVYLKLNRNIFRGLAWGIGIGILIIIYDIVTVKILKGHVTFNISINRETWEKDIVFIIKSAFGLYNILLIFSEEVVFRGFILQKISGLTKFWIANIINGILFFLIHVQGYIILNRLSSVIIINAFCGIFVFSLIEGYVLKKSNSLWACVLIHFFNDFISSAIMM